MRLTTVHITTVILLMFMLKTVNAQSVHDTLVCDRHSCCCTNDPTPAGVMISHVHEKHEWMVSYRLMNMSMNGMFIGTQPASQDDVFPNYLMIPKKMQMDMHMLMLMYGITKKLTVMGMFNYNTSSMSMKMYAATSNYTSIASFTTPYEMTHTMQTSGIGDIKLYALYSLLNTQKNHILISLGASIPTGRIDFKGSPHSMMYPNARYPYAMQLGSGTFDLLPCVNYLFQKEKLTASVQLSSVIRANYNTVGYHLGNEATLNAWFSYKVLPFLSSSLRIESTIADKISGNDPTLYYYMEPSANPNNYGGQKVNCFIGAVFQARRVSLRTYKLGAEYGIPVYQNLNGVQMPTKSSFFISVSKLF